MTEPRILFNRLEFLWRDGSWCRPAEWVWDICKYEDGCLELQAGWIHLIWWPRKWHHVDNKDRWT